MLSHACLREFVETAVILVPGARTGEVGAAFADTVSGSSTESGDEFREGTNDLKKTIHRTIFPENGFQMENSLTREETLKGMTIWGAYFNFEEHEKGSLEVGKSADFIVLNQNIMEVEADLIPNTEVIQTYIDGELVYSK